jgi:adenylate cyclase
LVGGFPVALLFAWMHQLAPVDGGAARAATGKLDWLLIGALVVIGLVSYQQLAPSPGTRTAEPQQASIALGTAMPAGISIAVLPFANLSGDAAQEFFSDGMTEEIMTALAKVSAFRVVARESAFQYKGQKTDMHAVGQALGAAYLIEGSVRKAGDQVRITAQLVQAGNGVSVWTSSYDRELKNIFATQSDIAEAIAGALRVPLGVKQGDSLVSNRTSDLVSYQQYLHARALRRSLESEKAIGILETVVARNPNFAPAWALRSSAIRQTTAKSFSVWAWT